MTAPDPVRAGRALNGAAAAVLLLEGIAALFVPRGIAQTAGGLSGLRLGLLLGLAVLLIVASGLQRRPRRGLVIGSVLQVPFLLTGLWTGAMWIVGGAFALIWLYLLQVRREMLGSPFAEPTAPPASPPAGRADGDGD